MKYIFVGDPHLDNQTPMSRLDDHRELTLIKLKDIMNIAIRHSVNAVIFSGDMFHRYEVPISYLVEISEAFREYSNNGIDVYSIIGNHDLPRYNMDYFYRTPLNLLFKSGLIKRLEYASFDNSDIYGLDFTKSLSDLDIQDNGKKKILVMHYSTDNTVSGDSISRYELKDFDLVLSGHDHTYYPLSGEKPIMMRPGSMVRRTKDDYNLKRDVVVYLYDDVTDNIEEIKLESAKKASLVFKNEVFNSSSIFSMSEVDFGKAFYELYADKDNVSIYSILKGLLDSKKITEYAYDEIKKYLSNCGISE